MVLAVAVVRRYEYLQPISEAMSVASSIDLHGVAVITGGASGFGYNTATRLVKAGMSVAILDISEDEMKESGLPSLPVPPPAREALAPARVLL